MFADVIALDKSVLIPLLLTIASVATDEGIHKTILGFGTYGLGRTTLIISNRYIKDVVKIVKSLKDPEVLIMRVAQTTKNGTKEQSG